MRRPRAPKLENPTVRRKLPVRKKPYYVAVSPGVFVGYCRNEGHCKWSVRVVRGRAEWTDRFATADDLELANGRDVLNYWQAVDQARALARGTDDVPDSKPMTVADALDAYERDLKTRGADPANAQRARKHLTATLAGKPVMLLSAQDLKHWRDNLVAKGVEPATINRTRAGLRAALELAATLDPRITNREAFRVGLKGLRNTKSARRAVLPDADVLSIVQAAYAQDRAFGVLVEVLAQTGARISQAARLTCGDLQADGPDPRLLMPTSYKGQGEKERQQVPVPITASLASLLDELRRDRPRDTPLLLKGDGTRWLATRKSEQWTIFREVAERAKFDPDQITCYALRHSSICRALLRGVPVSVVAKLHDTSAREIEAHYGAHILDVAGDALSRRGLLPEAPTADNVVTLPGWRS
jgi:integrase